MQKAKSDVKFSNLNREERIKKASDTVYDLIVIGGGITGAGIALDASLRGISTLLLEMNDFASGTSSKSTKLIHGGLRYLKQFEIALVRETGLERAIAHKNIPHLVHPETMLLPIVEEGTFNKFSASLAISVYDLLASVPKDDRKRSLSKRATIKREPLLNDSILKSGIAYSEYRTDDARLTIEIIKAAKRNGAELFNYMKVEDFILDKGKVIGVRCYDSLNKRDHNFHAKQIVSAAGPWVDELRTKDNSKTGKSLHLTKGVHIVLPRKKLPIQSAVYYDAFDGRMIFAIRRSKVTYLGTSDTDYKGDKNKVVCTKEDAKYILKTANRMFDVPTLKISDIISSWAGLRPLIHEDGKSASELSRKDEIFISKTKLISIAGGKLTGYRLMAKRVVDLIQKKDKTISQKKCVTKKYKIHANSFSTYYRFQRYVITLAKNFSNIIENKRHALNLVSTYGKHTQTIVKSALENTGMNTKQALLKAEIDYTIDYESATLPIDYINYRSGRLYFDIKSIQQNVKFIVSVFAKKFNWDKTITEKHVNLVQSYIEEVTAFT